MKELLVCVLLLCCGSSYGINYCCDKGEFLKGRICSNSKNISIACDMGYMLLKEIILDGTKLSTADSPSFTFASDPKDYCVTEIATDGGDAGKPVKAAIVCFQASLEDQPDVPQTAILSLVSVVFLVFTLLVYMFLPQLRDLQGLCFMCMCICMALGYLSLGILQFGGINFLGNVCTASGYILYFWLLAGFFWMNVISIVTYRTVHDASYGKRVATCRHFFLYSCYAWGSSLGFLIISLITEYSEGNHWKPGMGTSSCWFKGPTEIWIFFYGPVAVLILANITLFISSSVKLWTKSKSYEVSTLNILRYKFLLSLKLFLVMGVSWAFEIISFAHGAPHIIWYIMDLFNCLQGVVIFILLVLLRRRAILGLSELSCCAKFTKPLANKLSKHDDAEIEAIIEEEQAMDEKRFTF